MSVNIAAIISAIGTAISAIILYKKRLQYETSLDLLKNFYIPGFKILVHHFYHYTDKSDPSYYKFDKALSDFSKLIKDASINVSPKMQFYYESFMDASEDDKIKTYNNFCSVFLNNYTYYSKVCGRNELPLYYRTQTKLFRNIGIAIWEYIKVIFEILENLLLGFCVVSLCIMIILSITSSLSKEESNSSESNNLSSISTVSDSSPS